MSYPPTLTDESDANDNKTHAIVYDSERHRIFKYEKTGDFDPEAFITETLSTLPAEQPWRIGTNIYIVVRYQTVEYAQTRVVP